MSPSLIFLSSLNLKDSILFFIKPFVQLGLLLYKKILLSGEDFISILRVSSLDFR